MSSSSARYSSVAIVLHWVIAAAMLFQIMLGRATQGPRGADTFAIFQLHKSIGITILVLTVARLVWRLTHRPPPLPSRLKHVELMLARITHMGFYALLLGLPLTGWLIVSTSKIAVPTTLFGAIPWPHIPVPEAIRGMIHDISETGHEAMVWASLLLIALHVAGALKHHFIDRDDGLARMIPGAKAGVWFEPRLIMIVMVAFGLFSAAATYPWGRGPRVEPLTAPKLPPIAAAPAPVVQAVPKTIPVVKPEEVAVEAVLSHHWIVTKSASSLGFATTWSGTSFTGKFSRWKADILFDPDALASSAVTVSIDMASVSASDDQAGSALLGEEWFDATNHPKAVFTARRFTKSGQNRYIADGMLTVRGVSKPLTLPFTLTVKGDEAQMQGAAQIDRLAFGVGQGEWRGTSDIPAAVSVIVRLSAQRQK